MSRDRGEREAGVSWWSVTGQEDTYMECGGGGEQRGGWGRKGRRAGEWSQRPLTPGKKNNEGKGKVLVICNQTRNWRNLHGWGREREGSEKETWWSKQETEGMNRGEDVKGRGQRKRHGDPNKKQKVWTGGGGCEREGPEEETRGPNKKLKVWTEVRTWKGGARERDMVVQTRNRRYGQGWGHEREGPEKETQWSKQETEGMNWGEDGREREGPEKERRWSKQETKGMNRGEDVKGRG